MQEHQELQEDALNAGEGPQDGPLGGSSAVKAGICAIELL